VGFARRNYMVPVPEAESLEELNEKLLRDCLAYGSHKMAGRSESVSELFDQEKAHLLEHAGNSLQQYPVARGSGR
jgi:hypothetical protein